MTKIVFLDTNVFLHYQDFDQIDWLEIVQADEVTILIPPVSIRELNKIKEIHSRARLRKRAATILKKLYELFALGSRNQLRDGVFIELEDRDPLIDFASHNLNHDIQDDHLIASIIMCRDEEPSREITLVTADFGLTVMAKARRHRIKSIGLPDNLKLVEEPDAEQERIKDLEQEISQLKLLTPQVSLAFEDGSQHITFSLPRPTELSKDDVVSKMQEIKTNFPKRLQAPFTNEKQLTVGELLAKNVDKSIRALLHTATPEEIDNYNSELDKFYDLYALHLEDEISFANYKYRTIKLEVWLTNDGTAPAEDLDVFLNLPDGFALLNEDNLPEPPKPPEPPISPELAFEKRFQLNLNIPNIGYYPPTSILPPPNISAPKIKLTKSYEVEIHIQRLKHKLREPFDPLYLVFESYETAKSFHVDYEILVANLPKKSSGELHVIIQK